MEREDSKKVACSRCGFSEKPLALKIEVVNGEGIILCANCRAPVQKIKTPASIRTGIRAAKIAERLANPLKVCPKCGKEKMKTGFNKNRCRVDGYSSWCKMCSQGKAPGSDKGWVNPFPKDYFTNKRLAREAEAASWKERNSNEPH